MSDAARHLKAFAIAVNSHDRENPDHDPAFGIGMAHFDMERCGFDEGEEILPGVALTCDGGTTGNFRVMCNGVHGGKEVEAKESEPIHAVGRELVTVGPNKETHV